MGDFMLSSFGSWGCFNRDRTNNIVNAIRSFSGRTSQAEQVLTG